MFYKQYLEGILVAGCIGQHCHPGQVLATTLPSSATHQDMMRIDGSPPPTMKKIRNSPQLDHCKVSQRFTQPRQPIHLVLSVTQPLGTYFGFLPFIGNC